jgi:RNA polymerase sigma factor (sigma-70 family)
MAVENKLLPMLRRLAGSGDAPDGELLQQFVAHRHEPAFRALVDRHGPMVLGVCQRVLRHDQDAEDAFQATFLVLARKAGSVAPRELVGNWLFGVALRTANKARVRRARAAAARQRAIDRGAAMTISTTTDADVWRDVRPVLDEELGRLRDCYRAAVVLCDLEGLSRHEAARQLGWSEGTLSGRLARARKILADRLAKRGVTLSVAALAGALAENAAASAVPALLKINLTRAAVVAAAGQAVPAGLMSTQVTALAEAVVKSTLLSKVWVGLLMLAAVGSVATGANWVHHRTADADGEQPGAGAGRAQLPELEMHVIGVHGSKAGIANRGTVDVDVRAKGPVVLVLTSYFSVDWNVKVADGSRLTKVIVSGYNPQEVDGVPPGVPVINRSYFPPDASRRKQGWFCSHEYNTVEWRDMVRRLNDMTGLRVASFQSAYEGESFVVDGTRGRERGQVRLPSKTPARVEPTPEALLAAASGAELHVVGMYTPGTDDSGKPVDVEVRPTAKPIVLVLSSYMDAVWNVRPAPGARIAAVVVGGHFPQEVDGVPAGVPMSRYCPDFTTGHPDADKRRQDRDTFYAYKTDTLDYRKMVDKLNDATGLLVSSFQGEYTGKSFVVDGRRGTEHAQMQRKPRRVPVPVSAAELLAASKDAELHLVSIYSPGDRGAPVEVQVTRTDKPVVLAVASYGSALWTLKVPDGVKLKAIIVGGYFEQEFDGVPADVPVVVRTYYPKRNREFFFGHQRDQTQFENLTEHLKAMTGLTVTTAQLAETAKAFVVDGVRGGHEQ